MKKRTTDLVGLLLLGLLALAAISISALGEAEKEREEAEEEFGMRGRVAGRYAQEFLMTRDPATNTIPRERLLKAYAKAQDKRAEMAQKDNAIPVYWQERGPNNVGGRTRALLFDANDPAGNTVWAGGVAGGLWRTTDIDAAPPTWTNVDDFFDNLAITTIAQDPSNPSLMYFGTGERGFGNADGVRGMGIWRSADGGVTWDLMPTTGGNAFQIINKIVVDNTGQIYVATSSGLFRSSDGGATWPEILGTGVGAVNDNVQDFEIAAGGDLFAGIGGDGVYRFRNN